MTTTTNNPKIQDLGWLVPVGYAVDGTVRFTCKPIRAINDNIPMEYLLVGTKFQAVDGTRWFITSCYRPTQDDTHDRTKYVISCVRDNEPTTLDRYSKITEPLTTLRRHSNLEWDWEDTGGNCLAIVHGDMTADHGTYTMVTYLEGPFTYDDERDGIHATESIAVGTYPADDCEPLTMAYYCDWFDFITNHDFTTGIRKTTSVDAIADAINTHGTGTVVYATKWTNRHEFTCAVDTTLLVVGGSVRYTTWHNPEHSSHLCLLTDIIEFTPETN